jgi:hypothetical protein
LPGIDHDDAVLGDDPAVRLEASSRVNETSAAEARVRENDTP